MSSIGELKAAGYDTAVFDIGDVLIHFAYREHVASFGFPEDIQKRIIAAMFENEDWPEGDRGVVTTEEWLQLQIDNDPELAPQITAVFRAMGNTIVPQPYAQEWVELFQKEGFKTYYLSNYSAEMLRQTRERLTFLDRMDGGIFSCEVKCKKPDAQIYQKLLERYAIDPGRTVFFDDVPENVDTAGELGIKGIVFRPNIALQMLKK